MNKIEDPAKAGCSISQPIAALLGEIGMGGVPVKHHTHGKVGRRRSHLALKKKNLLVCKNCDGPKLSHRTCIQCGKK